MIDPHRRWVGRPPEDRAALFGLALALAEAGRRAEAALAFQALVERHPSSVAGWIAFGRFYLDHDDAVRARLTWRRGVEQLTADGASPAQLAPLRDALSQLG